MSEKKQSRFEMIHEENINKRNSLVTLLRDKETGIQYLYFASGLAGGLTPLLDQDGKAIIDPVKSND